MATLYKICKYALIDDSGNELSFYLSEYIRTKLFLSQCVRAHYNVTEDKILKFRWGNVVWDYAQVVFFGDLNIDARIIGFRLEVQSNFLNPYYQVQSILADKNEFIKHIVNIDYRDSSSVYDNVFRFNLRYKKKSHGYTITFDIIDKNSGYVRFVEEDGRLVASIHNT